MKTVEFSKTENEIMDYLRTGVTDVNDIAERRFTTIHAVNRQLESIRKKLKLKSTLELVTMLHKQERELRETTEHRHQEHLSSIEGQVADSLQHARQRVEKTVADAFGESQREINASVYDPKYRKHWRTTGGIACCGLMLFAFAGHSLPGTLGTEAVANQPATLHVSGSNNSVIVSSSVGTPPQKHSEHGADTVTHGARFAGSTTRGKQTVHDANCKHCGALERTKPENLRCWVTLEEAEKEGREKCKICFP